MGMVIAWHAVNAACRPCGATSRYTTSFVAFDPRAHGSRAAWRCLDPNRPDNIYDEMHLVPARSRHVILGESRCAS